ALVLFLFLLLLLFACAVYGSAQRSLPRVLFGPRAGRRTLRHRAEANLFEGFGREPRGLIFDRLGRVAEGQQRLRQLDLVAVPQYMRFIAELAPVDESAVAAAEVDDVVTAFARQHDGMGPAHRRV